MTYTIFSNPRFVANDFDAEYYCNFCPEADVFHSKLIEIPNTNQKICSTCLNRLTTALNRSLIAVGDKDSCFAYDAPYKDETDRLTSPCLRGIDFKIKGGKLITHIIYRSWDLYGGWPENMGGFTLLNEYVADQLGDEVEPGPMAFSCFGLHCYDFQIEVLRNILRKD